VSDSEGSRNGRPAVAVVLPFAGTSAEARAMLEALAVIELRPGDEMVIVDNQPGGAVPEPAAEAFRVVADSDERSSYFARNRGTEESNAPWLLFLDADCRPTASLLDEYFSEPPGDRCGIVAGGVVSLAGQPGFAAAYASDRGHVSELPHVEGLDGAPPAGITANLLVRREAFDGVGGFQEGVFSGADLEFCWRVQEAGWTLEHRPAARVEHAHSPTIAAGRRKARRYGSGRRWVSRRYPGRTPPVGLLRSVVRSLGGAGYRLLRLQPRRAVYSLLDGVWALELARGFSFGDNRSTTEAGDTAGTLLIAESWPDASEALHDEIESGEAAARARNPDRGALRKIRPRYAEDDLVAERAAAVAALLVRRPLSVLRDLLRSDRGSTPPLRELAPQARRLSASRRGVRVAEGAERRAERLLHLAGRGAQGITRP